MCAARFAVAMLGPASLTAELTYSFSRLARVTLSTIVRIWCTRHRLAGGRFRLACALAFAIGLTCPIKSLATELETLIKQLNSDDVRERKRACTHIADLGPGGAQAIPALTRALADEQVADHAVYALRRIGSTSIPALLREAKSDNEMARRYSIRVLGQLRQTDETNKAIQTGLKDSSARVRRECIHAIGEWGAVDLIKDVVKVLPLERNADVILESFSLFVQQREHSQDAIPILIGYLENELEPSEEDMRKPGPTGIPDPYIRAKYVLMVMGPDAVVPLARVLNDEKRPTFSRLLAARCLKSIRDDGVKIRDEIRPALRSESPEVRKVTRQLVDGKDE